jgi:hypothetical protein
VVDVLRLGTAVLATMAVPHENGAPIERDVALVRHSYKVRKPHDRGFVDHYVSRTEHPARCSQKLCLRLQDKEKSTPSGHNAEGLVTGIEDERSRHDLAPMALPGVPAAGYPRRLGLQLRA